MPRRSGGSVSSNIMEGTRSGGSLKISISRTGKLPREISIRVEYSFGGGGGVTVNHADVRGSTGNWIPDETRSNYSGK